MPRPGSDAFSNTFHREIIINTVTANQILIHTMNIPPTTIPIIPPSISLICHIASGLMLPVVMPPENSKEKFIVY